MTEDRWLDGITSSLDMSLSKFRVMVKERSLVCCYAWGRKELDTTERLNLSNCIIKHGIGDCYAHLILDNLNLEI